MSHDCDETCPPLGNFLRTPLVAHNKDMTWSLTSAQLHRGLEINSSRDDIILILIVGHVCYNTITGDSSQHSAMVLFDLYVQQVSVVTWTRFGSVLFKWETLQFLIVVCSSLQHPQ